MLLLFINSWHVHATNSVVTLWWRLLYSVCCLLLSTTQYIASVNRGDLRTLLTCDVVRKLLNKSPSSLSSRFLLSLSCVFFHLFINMPRPGRVEKNPPKCSLTSIFCSNKSRFYIVVLICTWTHLTSQYFKGTYIPLSTMSSAQKQNVGIFF